MVKRLLKLANWCFLISQLLFCCSPLKTLKEENNYSISFSQGLATQAQALKDDINWLKQHGPRIESKNVFGVKPYHGWYPFLVAKVPHFIIQPSPCPQDQIACTSNGKAFSIYLSKDLFEFSRFSRLATLFHERLHQEDQFEHKICHRSRREVPCDKSLDSPYGLELYFLDNLYRSKILQSATEKKKLKQAINLLSQHLELGQDVDHSINFLNTNHK